jgi:methanol--5-hydroxybenzimidazolylcobamide Co-methyltransferase
MRFSELAIPEVDQLLFGSAPKPVVSSHGVRIGDGRVIPELNFTLPPMKVSEQTRESVLRHYREILVGALKRSRELSVEQVVFEFETLLEMTITPSLGVEIVKTMRELCDEAEHRDGIKSTIRLTPNDIRDFDKPVKRRTSGQLQPMMELFEEGARAGGDLLSIESTGGKELHDDALLYGDLRQMIFSLAVLGTRDMAFLWERIVDVAARHGRIAGGDTACAFANTAMVLAEQHYIPRVLAAVDRVASIGRSLVAFEMGATGPDKDCGYEGPFMKAICGIPISMEGKTAACAHLSQVGNVAASCCDMWSNESVTNIRLLSGMAPTAYLEQLVYDTRLMNQAIDQGSVRTLQALFSGSDVLYDPQALVLAPDAVVAIARSYLGGHNRVEATVSAVGKALDLIEEAVVAGRLRLTDREYAWISPMRDQLANIPLNEDGFVAEMQREVEGAVTLSEYGL